MCRSMSLTRLALGTLRLVGSFNGVFFEPRKRSESRSFVLTALDAGFEAFDTAPLYGRGDAEELLGQVLPSDADVFTKVGVSINGSVPVMDFSVEGMKRSITDSLHRLRREQVQTLFIHNPPPAVLKRESIYEFMEWAKTAGLAKECGVSLAVVGDLPKVRDSRAVDAFCIPPPDSLKALRMPKAASLTLRSVLGGGDLARGAGADQIRRRLEGLIEVHRPANIIVGPRTSRHLVAYRPWLSDS